MVEDPLLELAVMWIGVFVASLLASKTKLTSVLYFLFIGALLVNLGVLPTETAPFIRGVAELGIILEIETGVVGGEDGDDPSGDALADGLHVGLLTQWRGHLGCGALGLDRLVGEEQVMG